MFRHGDILIVPSTVPDVTKTVRRRNGRLVLAEGEATGHAHTITSKHAKLVTAEQADELRMWLLVTAPVELEHQEHATLTIPPGEYEVRRQREYSPEEIRTVAD